MAYTDYHKASGDGTLKIRDYGEKVEFWVKAGYSNFHWENLSFSWTANGSTTNKDYDYPLGGDWEYLGYRNVTTSQTVTFRLLESTGTSSLAGPTTHSVALDRDTVPAAPDAPTFSSITSTSAVVSFTDNSNGGATIDSRQLAYRIGAPTGTLFSIASDGSTLVSGLTPGTTYYFWARVHNYKGYSAYSAYKSFTTLNVPAAPGPVTLSEITQNSVHAIFSGNSNGGSAILEWQIGYGTDPVAPTNFISGWNLDITGLDAGETYYFWARGRNAIGWGPWSVRSSATLLAGVMLKVGAAYVRAVPYQKVAGVWHVLEPWARSAGFWNKTI